MRGVSSVFAWRALPAFAVVVMLFAGTSGSLVVRADGGDEAELVALGSWNPEEDHTNAGATASTTDSLYAFGRSLAGHQCAGDAHRFDLLEGDWTGIASIPDPCRVEGAAVGLPDGRVALLGGTGTGGGYGLRDVHVYDPGNDSWMAGPDMPRERYRHGAVLVNGDIWVFGGQSCNSGSCRLSDVDRLDLETWTWQANVVPNSPVDGDVEPVVVGDALHIFGGWDCRDERLRHAAWTGTEWMIKPDLPGSLFPPHAEAVGVGGRILVFEGMNRGCGGAWTDTNRVWSYDLADDSWQAESPLPFPIHGSAMEGVGGCGAAMIGTHRSSNVSSQSWLYPVDGSASPGSVALDVQVEGSVPATESVGIEVQARVLANEGCVVTSFQASHDGVAWTPWATIGSPIELSLPDVDGSHSVMVRVRDLSGVVRATQESSIVLDRGAPGLVVPEQVRAEVASPEGTLVRFEVEATDGLDAAPRVSCSPESGASFPLGRSSVTCLAEDWVGNQAQAAFEVVVEDTVAPELVVPSGLVVEATAAEGAVVNYEVTAWDAGDDDPAIDCAPASGSVLSLGEHSVVCVASDAAGNGATADFSVTVRDTSAPVLEPHPDAGPIEASSTGGARFAYERMARDAVDGVVEPACNIASGSWFPIGTTQVDCVVQDSRGNEAADSFQVEVVDTTPPDSWRVRLLDPLGREVTPSRGTLFEAVTVQWESVDNTAIADFLCLLDGVPVDDCAPGMQVRAAEGWHDLVITAIDDYGNYDETPAMVAWKRNAPEEELGQFISDL